MLRDATSRRHWRRIVPVLVNKDVYNIRQSAAGVQPNDGGVYAIQLQLGDPDGRQQPIDSSVAIETHSLWTPDRLDGFLCSSGPDILGGLWNVIHAQFRLDPDDIHTICGAYMWGETRLTELTPYWPIIK